MQRIIFLALAAMMACTVPAGATTVVYRCPLNVDIAANYAADDTVTVLVQGETFVLPRAISGSGAKYSDGKTTIWEHQGEALFETPGVSFTGCKLQRDALTPPPG